MLLARALVAELSVRLYSKIVPPAPSDKSSSGSREHLREDFLEKN